MYKYLFGPVLSRRLGVSLGIDIIPRKVCSLDCVYCEVGKTTKLTLERKEYVPYTKIIRELDDYMQNNEAPDYITFSGSGEPTLNIRFGDIVNYIKKNFPKIKLAVLTNGTLLNDKKVRGEMLPADLILPSLDAVSETAFAKIDRPNSNIKMEEYIQGIADLRKEFKGEMWLEILLLPNYNDSEQDIDLMKDAIAKIQPNKVQLNTLDRPGTIADLQPLSKSGLEKIAQKLGFDNIEIIAKAKNTKVKSSDKNFEEIILSTLSRRPCTFNDLQIVLGIKADEIKKHIDNLFQAKKIIEVEQKRGVFYKPA